MIMSTEDPKAFWQSIAELSGWRLLTYDGFADAVFFTIEGSVVTITYPVARLLDTLVCALGEITEDVFDLLEVAREAVDGTPPRKKNATAFLKKDLGRINAHMLALKQELPNFFRHYDEQAEIEEIMGTA
jgi:hypothetical protein